MRFDAMIGDRSALPTKIGEPILRAQDCKESLLDLLAPHGANPTWPRISTLL